MTHDTLLKRIKKTAIKNIDLHKAEVIKNFETEYPFAKFELVESSRYEKNVKFEINCIYEKKIARISFLTRS